MTEDKLILIIISICCGIGVYAILSFLVTAWGYEEGAHPVWVIFGAIIAYNFIKKK
ncbi:hypothetical protein [Runella salmonicolor]|uniref:Uncharacterized protein n=1 Tax=Runella salmonicolor TaxID=2950278 RepID=A0ABT1FRE5_9BACT|nr:hypothetical protein [Runella salmonicolor]MCP1384065.1 hypothetical protein [Runella salmonicolor]